MTEKREPTEAELEMEFLRSLRGTLQSLERLLTRKLKRQGKIGNDGPGRRESHPRA